MTHPLFRQDMFIETAFERRFQAMLRLAWHQRSWHVIVADPGSGKTMGIRDMVRTAGSLAILAVTAPKNGWCPSVYVMGWLGLVISLSRTL